MPYQHLGSKTRHWGTPISFFYIFQRFRDIPKWFFELGVHLSKTKLVKIYKYKIKPGTEQAYLRIQEQAQALYQAHAEVEIAYLKDVNDPLRRTEVIHYFDSDPLKAVKKIDSDPRVLALFKKFEETILDKSEPIQEDVLEGEDLSFSGKYSPLS